MHTAGFGIPRFPEGNPRQNNSMPVNPGVGSSPLGGLPPELLQELQAQNSNQGQIAPPQMMQSGMNPQGLGLSPQIQDPRMKLGLGAR